MVDWWRRNRGVVDIFYYIVSLIVSGTDDARRDAVGV
jgi:hypothetical protein